MKAKITLEIDIDNDVERLYPNYKMNFRTKEAFLAFIITSIIPTETDSFGYNVSLLKTKVYDT